MILGNLGSVLGQLGSIPLGVGKAKGNIVPGLKSSLEQTVKEVLKADKTAPIYKSQFLKERYTDALFRRFDQRMIDQPKKFAAWMMETAEKSGTRLIWNSMYHKGVKEPREGSEIDPETALSVTGNRQKAGCLVIRLGVVGRLCSSSIVTGKQIGRAHV